MCGASRACSSLSCSFRPGSAAHSHVSHSIDGSSPCKRASMWRQPRGRWGNFARRGLSSTRHSSLAGVGDVGGHAAGVRSCFGAGLSSQRERLLAVCCCLLILTKRLIILGYHGNSEGFRNFLPLPSLWNIFVARVNYFIWRMKEHHLSVHHLTASYFRRLRHSYYR